MLQIRMEQTYGKIAIRSGPAKLSLETVPPTVETHSEAAKLEISSLPGKLEIDQTPCRYSLGIKNWETFAKENVGQAGMQALLEYTGKVASEGDQLAAIENHGNPIRDMAFQNIMDPEVSVEYVAIQSPNIHYTPSWPQIRFIAGGVTFNPQMGKVINDTQATPVEVSMAQYPSLRIWVAEAGNFIDYHV